VDLLAYHTIATTPGDDLRLHLLQPLTVDGHYESMSRVYAKPRKPPAKTTDIGQVSAIARHMKAAGNSDKAIAAALGLSHD
jgi:hypothetical protein